jgi:hypothetical protein
MMAFKSTCPSRNVPAVLTSRECIAVLIAQLRDILLCALHCLSAREYSVAPSRGMPMLPSNDTTSHHVQPGLEREIFREDIPQRLRLLLLYWSPTYSLPIGVRNSNDSRDRRQRVAPSQRAILYMHGGCSVGPDVSPAFADWLVPSILRATEDSIHLQRPRHLPQDCTPGKTQSLRLLFFYLAEKR